MKWTDLENKELKIWRNGYNGKMYYTTSIANKKEDGKYDNYYIDVQIPKDAVVDNGENVLVKRGFISFYRDKNGLAKLKVVILELENSDLDLPF